MPLTTSNSRPVLPYVPAKLLPKNNRYAALGNLPPTAEQLDADINFVVDVLNNHADAINEVEAGSLAGANVALNADKLLTTNGEDPATLSWTLVNNQHLEQECVDTDNLIDQCVTTDKIASTAVGLAQMNANSVSNNQIIDNTITFQKIRAIDKGQVIGADNTGAIVPVRGLQDLPLIGQGDNTPAFKQLTTPAYGAASITNACMAPNSVSTNNVVAASITNACMAPLSVTPPNISSAGAAAGTVLTSGAGALASFLPIPTFGQVLQVVSLVYDQTTLNEYDAACSPTNLKSFQAAPFSITITPKLSNNNSIILIYYSIALGGNTSNFNANNPGAVTFCKNNNVFFAGSNGVTNRVSGVAPGPKVLSIVETAVVSNLFTDNAKTAGTPVVYELMKATPYTNINNSYSANAPEGSLISTMIAVEIGL